jgi:CheY-like chemotaxis protein
MEVGAHATDAIRLLVVDDDEGIRTLLEINATLDGRFAVAGTAASGAEALERVVTQGPIHVVLLDVTLPDADGIDIVRELKQRAGDPAPAVALFTGWSDPATHERARAAGADAVFGKDGDPKRLLDSLAQLVRPSGG